MQSQKHIKRTAQSVQHMVQNVTTLWRVVGFFDGLLLLSCFFLFEHLNSNMADDRWRIKGTLSTRTDSRTHYAETVEGKGISEQPLFLFSK